MEDFDSILQRSLATINVGYQTAFDDVKSVVQKISSSIKRSAGENFDLEVQEISDDVGGSTLRVYLDTDSSEPRAEVMTIVHIRIPSNGYPIFQGGFSKSSNRFSGSHHDAAIADKNGVEEFFRQMLINPESPLIQALGFALRVKANKVR